MNTSNTAAAPVKLDLKVIARRPALLAGFDNTVDILVKVEGPEFPSNQPPRTPLNLALVLDRSGSMAGPPIAEAVRCAKFIIENLQESDRAALVVYDNNVNVLVPSTELTQKSRFLEALATITSGGQTDLHNGWLHGAQEAAGYVAPNRISRVMLLSDGQANFGLTDVDTITKQCGQLADTGVSTSTYGLGYQFNEDLMVAMAKAGCGNSYYGETADDLMEPFQREFDLMSALCAKQVQFNIQPVADVNYSVLNPYLYKDDFFTLPDIAYGSAAWVIVRLKVPASLAGNGDGSRISLAKVTVKANDMKGLPLLLSSAKVELASLPPQAWSSLSEDETVRRQVGEIEAANIQIEAKQAARVGDWETVNRLLADARQKAADNPWISVVLDTLEWLAQRQDRSRFNKESSYSSDKIYNRLHSSDEMAYHSEMEHNSPSYLRRKPSQGKSDTLMPQPTTHEPKPNKFNQLVKSVKKTFVWWDSRDNK